MLLDCARISSQNIIRKSFREINLTECRNVNIINCGIKAWKSVKGQHSACAFFKKQLFICFTCDTLSWSGANPNTPLVANRRELTRLHCYNGDISFWEGDFFNSHTHLRLELAVGLYSSEVLEKLVGDFN